MSLSTRRNFLLTSSGALAGTLISPNVLQAETKVEKKSGSLDYFLESGLVTGLKKPLLYESIPGFLSAEQIACNGQVFLEGF